MRDAARAQDWTNVLQLSGTMGSSAFFFNAQEGLIGTGNYLNNIPAQIYYTENGGRNMVTGAVRKSEYSRAGHRYLFSRLACMAGQRSMNSQKPDGAACIIPPMAVTHGNV